MVVVLFEYSSKLYASMENMLLCKPCKRQKSQIHSICRDDLSQQTAHDSTVSGVNTLASHKYFFATNAKCDHGCSWVDDFDDYKTMWHKHNNLRAPSLAACFFFFWRFFIKYDPQHICRVKIMFTLLLTNYFFSTTTNSMKCFVH